MRSDAFTVARLRLLYVAMNVCFYVRRPYFSKIRGVVLFAMWRLRIISAGVFVSFCNKSKGGLFFLLSPYAAGTEVQLLIFLLKEKK